MYRRSRRNDDALSFGSDSFLDIVANIVGILIILIVLVGVRVKNAPIQKAETPPVQEVEEEDLRLQEYQREKQRIEEENRRRLQDHQRQMARHREQLEERETLRRRHEQKRAEIAKARTDRERDVQTARQRRREIDAETAKLRDDVENLRSQVAAAESEQRRREDAKRSLRTQIEQTRAQAETLVQQARKEMRQIEEQTRQWNRLQSELTDLRDEIAAVESAPSQVTEWVHYPSAISKTVNQEEAQFRCMNGKVAYTYLDEMLRQIVQRADLRTLAQRPVISGTAGPEGGFRMSYVISRTSPSLSTQLGNPFSGSARLSSFELSAESDDLGETQEDALRPGSKFLTLLSTRPSRIYTVTLWVYPDSFTLAKEISAYLHQRGYEVALRPLPHGVPIAGSPQGSRSRAQ